MNARHTKHRPRSGNSSGFTLMELLIVIMIMGLLLSIALPFGGMMDDKARTKATLATMQGIRKAILGERNTYDEHGHTKLGGYAGDVGRLPKLYRCEWNAATERVVPSRDGENNLVPVSNNYSEVEDAMTGDDFASPLALWDDSIADVDGAERCYLEKPHDAYPDDQVWNYTGTPIDDEDRRFLLRECAGRLSDGWGRSLIIYAEGLDADDYPLNLVFVSAGPDGRYCLDDECDGAVDEDNIEMRIAESDWNFDADKVAETWNMLQKIKRAIIGKEGIYTDGKYEPNGFIADIGSVDPLTGSYVRYGAVDNIYRCNQTYEMSGIDPTDADYWDNLGNDNNDSLFYSWEDGRNYYGYDRSLDILLINSHFVIHNAAIYRCIQTHSASIEPGPGGHASWVDYWKIDNEIQVTDTIGYSWNSGKHYLAEIVGESEYNDTARLYFGWKKQYLDGPLIFPVADGWGNQIECDLDTAKRDIILKSRGADTAFVDSTDDQVVIIKLSEYACPLWVMVKDTTIEVADTTDSLWLDLFTPFNGSCSFIRAYPDTIYDDSAHFVFRFGDTTTAKVFGSGRALTYPIDYAEISPPDSNYASAHIPIGRKMIRFTDSAGDLENTFRKYNVVIQPGVPSYIDMSE